MSTISEKLTQLNTIKGDIKTAINNKGGEVGNDFSTYATAINNLSAGSGGSSETYENPEFYELRTQKGTNYDNLFYGSYEQSLDLSNWNTSKCISMDYMFANCNKLTSLDLSSFDTSNVIYMSNMFANCNKLTSLDLSSFDTSNVTTMSRMFYNCASLTSLDLSSFDTSNVTTMDRMFSVCIYLTTVVGYLDLSNLTNGFTPSLINNPTYSASMLETLYLKNIYKNCTMTNASKWSINLSHTKIKDSCLLYIIDQLPNLYEKGITNNTNIVLTLPPINTLTQEQVQVALDKGWQVANVNFS